MKNIEKKIFTFGLCLCLALANVITALAGGALEQVDITGNVPSPIPGQLVPSWSASDGTHAAFPSNTA